MTSSRVETGPSGRRTGSTIDAHRAAAERGGLRLQASRLDAGTRAGHDANQFDHLGGEYYKHDEAAKLVHFTEGGPYYEATRHVDFANEWLAEFESANSSGDSDVFALCAAAKEAKR